MPGDVVARAFAGRPGGGGQEDLRRGLGDTATALLGGPHSAGREAAELDRSRSPARRGGPSGASARPPIVVNCVSDSEANSDGPLGEIEVPELWARSEAVAQNAIRQLLAPAQRAEVERAGDNLTVALETGLRYPVVSASASPGDPLALKLPRFIVRDPSQLDRLSVAATWVNPPAIAASEDVARDLASRLSFAEERDGSPGLRRAQLGAIHAVLAEQSVTRRGSATVVMPTGTGKTDAMVALLAHRPRRLLVLVPSDALREQTVSRFLRLGVLRDVGALPKDVPFPVVGEVKHAFETEADASLFADRCNVIVATAAALHAARPEYRDRLIAACEMLFVDEAHHVKATTWSSIRDAFVDRPVVQFTATPFRRDGARLGGRIIYDYPLSQAQADGIFAPIDYTAIDSFERPDEAIAEAAVARLRRDLEAGHDHVLMARVNTVERAESVRRIYADLADDLGVVCLHSRLPAQDQREGKAAAISRQSRVIVCVSMLGEGFDLPQLKVAAIHDAHRSLSVTLQLIGRFTRTSGNDLGRASVFVRRPRALVDPNLRTLYAENADWNNAIRDLSERSVGRERDLDEFEKSFAALPDEIPIHALAPKMSMQVYRAPTGSFTPMALEPLVEDRLVARPIAVNLRQSVAWYVTREHSKVRWGKVENLVDTAFHLRIVRWHAEHRLLYVYSSDLDEDLDAMAAAASGGQAVKVEGENVFRAMAGYDRLIPSNVGLLSILAAARRFTMHAGSDVAEAFPATEAEHRAKTNVTATGFSAGERVTIGVSLRGRIWSPRSAESIKEWVDWADAIGPKLINESLVPERIIDGLVIPKEITGRPEAVLLSVEWDWNPFVVGTDEGKLTFANRTVSIVDVALAPTDHQTSGPVRFDVRSAEWVATYQADVKPGNVTFSAVGDEVLIERGANPVPLSQMFQREPPLLVFDGGTAIYPPSSLLELGDDHEPISRERLTAVDWAGIDITKESQGPTQDQATVQARVATWLTEADDWDVLIDDDGTGEIADLVALRRSNDELHITLAHCKYSGGATPGARITDLYEVCGQAMRSASWRQRTDDLISRLLYRERRRRSRGVDGVLVGTAESLLTIEADRYRLRPVFRIVVAQPGLSIAKAGDRHLQLLAATQSHVAEVAGADTRFLLSS